MSDQIIHKTQRVAAKPRNGRVLDSSIVKTVVSSSQTGTPYTGDPATVSSGDGIEVVQTNNDFKVSHGNTSDQENISADGNTEVISSLSFDEFGHVTGTEKKDIKGTLDELYISKQNDDTASGQITFKSGIVVQADSVNTVSGGLMETSDTESATVSGGVTETTSEEEATGTTLGSLTNVNSEVDQLSPYDVIFGRKAGSEKYSSIMLKNIRPTSSAIVNTYQEMIDLDVSAGLLIVLVTSDTKNNNGNPSEYRKYANGITMWQASININQL